MARTVLDRIADVVELSSGRLALILVVGPPLRAPEGLALVRARLPAERPTLWYRLDDPDVEPIPRAVAGHPSSIVLAHGLEYLSGERLRAAMNRLNLGRDALGLLDAAVVIWIPQDHHAEFRERCADLFQWRSALVLLEETDVPAPPAVEALRAYQLNASRWRPAPFLHFLGESGRELVEVPRAVVVEGGTPEPLIEALTRHPRVLLRAMQGAGKSHLLTMARIDVAHRGLSGDCPLPCVPIEISARQLIGAKATTISAVAELLESAPREAHWERWAEEGRVVVLVDDCHHVADQDQLVGALRALSASHPRLHIVAATSRMHTDLPDWKVVEPAPWTAEDSQLLWRRAHEADPLGTLSLEDAQSELAPRLPAVTSVVGATPITAWLMYALIHSGRRNVSAYDHVNNATSRLLERWGAGHALRDLYSLQTLLDEQAFLCVVEGRDEVARTALERLWRRAGGEDADTTQQHAHWHAFIEPWLDEQAGTLGSFVLPNAMGSVRFANRPLLEFCCLRWIQTSSMLGGEPPPMSEETARNVMVFSVPLMQPWITTLVAQMWHHGALVDARERTKRMVTTVQAALDEGVPPATLSPLRDSLRAELNRPESRREVSPWVDLQALLALLDAAADAASG